MCFACWNVDFMEKKRKAGDTSCDGMEMQILSINEMKRALEEEWIETNQTEFRVYKQAIPEMKKDTLSWVATHGSKKQRVTVSFQ